ncbi:winged helix DNA-binding domain-containing protein [Streptomyces sp. NPDC001339]|uniref:winged helix DNA-binding domain-containing protein n=1 Tax=Streptomyces sp. NPDC001339 TaxID=3364563 RepID=UPI0036B17C81
MDSTVEQRLTRIRRAGAQAIGGGIRCGSVTEALTRVVGVQAQDVQAAALGLRARIGGLSADDVWRATGQERTAVRGWFMRGTLQLVPAGDARWLLALLGPVFRKQSERRLRELAVDPQLCARAERLIGEALAAEGPLTREELTERLAGIGVPAKGQAAFHLIRYGALSGQLCHGPDRNGRATFVPLDAWLPQDGPLPWQGEAAVVELARRYRAGYGPATAQDFATWSGLTLSMAKRAWPYVPDRDHDDVAGLGTEAEVPDVRLLPAYDNYLTAYRGRELSVPTAHERQVWPGGGQLRPTVVVDGWAVGTWNLAARGTEVRVSPFAELSGAVRDGIAKESADIARFGKFVTGQ